MFCFTGRKISSYYNLVINFLTDFFICNNSDLHQFGKIATKLCIEH